MFCWMDGQYQLAEELRISPLEHGYLYGVGFFETFRTYDGVAVYLDEHMARLQEALQAYHLAMPYTVEEIREVIETLTEQADGQDGYFRLNVAAGNYGLGLQPATYDEVTVIVFRKELGNAPVVAKTAHWIEQPRNTPEHAAARFKSHHFGNNVLARQQLPNLAQYEGFFTTTEGYVAEGVTSNIFWVTRGELYTPQTDIGILAGVTRAKVIALAKRLGIPVYEGRFAKQQLEQADEVFVTNSIQELVPIGQLEQSMYAGVEGSVFKQLAFAYQHAITEEIQHAKF